MILETERLFFRRYSYDDFDELYQILSDPETMKYYPAPYDKEGTIKWIRWNLGCYEKRGYGLFAVILKSENKFIGDCGITLQHINGIDRMEIGYHINKNYWNNGYATEAARFFKEFFFTNTDYNEVYSYMNFLNIASRKVAEHNNMKLVEDYYDNEEHLAVYRITREEYETNKKNN